MESAVWQPLRRPELGAINVISDLIETLEKKNKNLLTSLRLGPTLILLCDYSGQHNSATHEAFSFFLADLIYCWRWEDARKEVRRSFLRDSRRMSFKALNDRRRQKALIPFLRAADSIPGLLFTVVIEKSLKKTIFNFASDDAEDSDRKFSQWNTSAFQRFMLMGHLGSLLLSGLSAPKQNVIWLTDEDDLAANDARIIQGTNALVNISSNYLSHTLSHLRYGTTRSDPGDLSIEDFAALPDLAAGALNEIVISVPISDIFIRAPHSLSTKTRNIAGWLSESFYTLKKLTFVVDKAETENVRIRDLTLLPEYSNLYF